MILTNNSMETLNLEFYNYIGQKVFTTSLDPFNYLDLSSYLNQAHYLLIEKYKSIIKLR